MSATNGHPSEFQRRWPSAKEIVWKFLNTEHVSQAKWHELFEDIFSIISWEESARSEMYQSFTDLIKMAIKKSQQRVIQHQDESALLKAYIHEWSVFSGQSVFLPQPFAPLDNCLGGKHNLSGSSQLKLQYSIIRKCMLDLWDVTIFEGIRQNLENSAMNLIQKEREGSTINSTLVIGVRESCVSLSASSTTKAWSYVEHFEAAYVKSMESFYRPRTSNFLAQNGISAYLGYAHEKLAEEEMRARLYLDQGPNFSSVSHLMKACVNVFIIGYLDEIIAEFRQLLEEDDRPKLRQVYEMVKRCSEFDTPTAAAATTTANDPLHVVTSGDAANVPPPSAASTDENPLFAIFEDYIWLSGSNELRDNTEFLVKDADKYVNTLLDIFNRFSAIIEESFHNDPTFLTVRDKAYQRLVNDTSIFSIKVPESVKGTVKRPESRCPNLLAAYCDLMLRKSPASRRLTSEEIRARLKNVLLVLKYVNSKDLFMEAHKVHVMRRLILETSADNDLEERMVDDLREVGMPSESVNRLARMFQDVKVSQDLTREFHEKMRKNNSNNLAASANSGSPFSDLVVNIKILSSGTWLPRSLPKVALVLPPELEDFIPLVEEFYKEKHQGRQLVWQYHLSHGVVAYSTSYATPPTHREPDPPGPTSASPHPAVVMTTELEMTTLQMVVFFTWRNRGDEDRRAPGVRLKLDSLITATGLSDFELRRTLWSLCERPKIDQQLISYAPRVTTERDFTNDTDFWINPLFGVSRPGGGVRPTGTGTTCRRRINMIGRLALSGAAGGSGCGGSGGGGTVDEETQQAAAIVQLRQLRAQEAVVKVMKVRKCLRFPEIYQEVCLLLRDQFLPTTRMLKEVIEWLIERAYIQRSPSDIDKLIYTS